MIKKILFSAIIMVSYSNYSNTMEAPKRPAEYRESSMLKKACVDTSEIKPTAIEYLCAVHMNNKLCYKQFSSTDLLRRHIRETHGLSPKHIERYSIPAHHCEAEFK